MGLPLPAAGIVLFLEFLWKGLASAGFFQKIQDYKSAGGGRKKRGTGSTKLTESCGTPGSGKGRDKRKWGILMENININGEY